MAEGGARMRRVPYVGQFKGRGCVHDYSLDGDEGLHVGAVVEAVDEEGGVVLARVCERDEQSGWWFLETVMTSNA